MCLSKHNDLCGAKTNRAYMKVKPETNFGILERRFNYQVLHNFKSYLNIQFILNISVFLCTLENSHYAHSIPILLSPVAKLK